jgi:hypothetical protein
MMLCSKCNAASSKKVEFTIPTGSAKVKIVIFQCRGCQNVDIEKEERDN